MQTQEAPKGIFLLVNLTRWTENKLKALLEANTQETFDKAFDDFLAADAMATVNGVEVTRDEYKKQMRDSGALGPISEGATVRIEASVEQQEDGEGDRAGFVGVFGEVTVFEKFRVFGAPAEYKVIFSINAVIKQDPSLPPPTPAMRQFFDGRRAFVVNQVVTRQSVPIRPPTTLVDQPTNV